MEGGSYDADDVALVVLGSDWDVVDSTPLEVGTTVVDEDAPLSANSPVLEPVVPGPTPVDSASTLSASSTDAAESNAHPRRTHAASTPLRIVEHRTCYPSLMRVPLLLAMLTTGVFGCRTTPQGVAAEASDASTQAAERAQSLDAALQSITADALRKHVRTLASDSMRGRATPSPQLDEAAEYVALALAGSGIGAGPSNNRKRAVACGPVGESAFNVLGMLPGTTDEVLMVTAHYDHVGEAPEGDDRIFNGANDNASGVAAMLALAHALARAPTQPRRTIAFVAFCGEEHQFRGSTAFTADPPFPLDNVVAMFNLEMLGHPDPVDARRAWVTGHAYSSLHDWLDRGGVEDGVTFVPGKTIGPVEGDAFERSDNLPFASSGVVAHTIAAGPLDEHYHAVSDETSRVDFDAMVPIVRSIARAVDALARSEERPVWSEQAPRRFTRPARRTSRP